MMRERALRIGEPSPLAGVATEPPDFDWRRPAVLILNSGVMHHVGSCRLSVKVAREVASRGMLAVRFDFSGVGDSEPRRGTQSFEETSTRECSEVMDYIERTKGTKQFIVFGLCSGADAAYNTALADDRVVGFAQIDGYCYVTWRYYLRRYWPAVVDPRRWARLLGRRRFWRRSSRSSAEGVSDEFMELPAYRRVFPPRLEVAKGFRSLVRRDVNIYVNFTGGEPHYNYAQQFRDAFRDVDFRGLLKVDYYPLTNHIITQADDQRRIVANISGWAAGLPGMALPVEEHEPARASRTA